MDGERKQLAREAMQPAAVSTPWSLPRAYVLCQVLGWAGYSLMGVWISSMYLDHDHWKLAISYLVFAVAGLIITHTIRSRAVRGKWMRMPLLQMLPRLAGVSVAGGTILLAVLYTFTHWICRITSAQKWTLSAAVISEVNISCLVGFWLLIYVTVHLVRQRREAQMDALRFEVLAQEAQHRSLAAQVNPHFLFNALNSLRGLIHEDVARADLAVTHLAGVLRYGLTAKDMQAVPLEQELAVVEDYLALERIRFEERLRVVRRIEPGVERAMIPPMTLQHLVENALKHGLSQLPEGGEIELAAYSEDGMLIVEVWNPGFLSGRIAVGVDSTQTGLKNTCERLRLLYGKKAVCELTQEGDRVRARMVIPSAGIVTAEAPKPSAVEVEVEHAGTAG